MRFVSLFLSIVLISLTFSCARVQQVDRARLAKKIMQPNPTPKLRRFVDDFHATREGAAGGLSQNGGGGCGCK